MPLSNEKIAELIKKRDAPRRTGTGGRRKFNINDRSYQAWFALHHELHNPDTGDPAFCDNPNCVDPRDKTHGQSVVDLDGKKVCRFCFLEGWLTTNPEQTTLETTDALSA